MSIKEKLVQKIKAIPANFTYSDLRGLMAYLGYEEDTGGKTSGSRTRFVHVDFAPITIHRPHPGDIVKRRMLRMIVDKLEERGQI